MSWSGVVARARGAARSFEVSQEALIALASLWLLLSANARFFAAALQGMSSTAPATWLFAACLALGVFALHALLLGLVCTRWTLKPALAITAVVGAVATYFVSQLGAYLDPSMMRNVLRTNPAEAKELLSPMLALHLLVFAGLPLLGIWAVRVRERTWRQAVLKRALLMAGALLALVAAVMLQFQPLASLMRNHKEVRYLITPANALWSTTAVLAQDARGATKPRQPIGLDAAPGASWATRAKPRVLVLVVGETARAANWGLSGYARQTTPQLAKLDVVNFADVKACGTNTETSLPCMFAPVGRRDYNESAIRGQQSLLHVVQRAGVQVDWRDNQSGCKGVCEGLPERILSKADAPAFCSGDGCLDEALVADLDQRLNALAKPGQAGHPEPTTQLWVLHMLGNHGPAYYRRYPPAFARFTPDCRNDDLRQCSKAEIVNAYDNALLYTDHVLARAIAELKAHAASVDSALLYVSDHGESLGESGLFLHGVPYAIAPDVQTQVPMVFWASEGFGTSAGMAPGCLANAMSAQASQPQSHDHLFHTTLGLLDVNTALHEPTLDLTRGCRAAP